MDLPDATLMFLVEAAGYPAVAGLAQSAYERLVAGEDVGYRVLQDLVGEASGTGVLRAMRQKHGPVAFEAIVCRSCRRSGGGRRSCRGGLSTCGSRARIR